MQVSAQKTVFLDGTEIRDIIAAYLREQGILPKGQKFQAIAITGPKGVKDDNSIAIGSADDLRIKIVWAMNDAPSL